MANKRDSYEQKAKRNDPSFRRVHGNYPPQKNKKGTPAVTRLSFEMTGDQIQYIDVAKALSAVNRRHYRQGLYYYVQSIEVYNNADSFVDFFTAPDTWVTKAAHRRGKAIWDEMNDRAMQNTGAIIGKYHDFKVFLDKDHRAIGSELPNLHRTAVSNVNITVDDWEYSQMVSADDDQDGIANADQWYLHLVGAHNGSSANWDDVGLIKSYSDTRTTVQQVNPENPPIADLLDDPLTNLFDYSSEEQMNDVLTILDTADNEQTPYDHSSYIGEQDRHLVNTGRAATVATNNRVAMIPGFCAPCGLIKVHPAGVAPADSFRVIVNVASGNYNGVYAERI